MKALRFALAALLAAATPVVISSQTSSDRPTLIGSTYWGGSGGETSATVAIDRAGNVYVAGTTASADFPKTVSSLPAGGGGDVFVSKFDAAGALVFSTTFGGSSSEIVNRIAVDASGNIVVVGSTWSADLPVMNAIQPEFHLGGCDEFGGICGDGFVAKIDSTGRFLVFASYLGTTADDTVSDVAVDPAGDIFIAGSAGSPAFAGAVPLRPFGGTRDAFVAKLPPSGDRFTYFTFLGGSFDESGNGIAIDALGNAYVTGVTASQNFPIVNPVQALPENFSTSAFVTKLNADGAIAYSTYLSGNDSDRGARIAVDAAGAAYVVGTTQSTNFPTVHASQPFLRGRIDVFVARLDPSGSRLSYSTYLGGNNVEQILPELSPALDIAIDAAGNAYVSGLTESADFTAVNAFQRFGGGVCPAPPSFTPDPCADAFVTMFDAEGTLVFSTPIGGNLHDRGQGVAIASDGALYAVGITRSPNFPLRSAIRQTLSGSSDAFIVKIATVPPLCQLPAPVPVSPAGAIFDDQPAFSWQPVPGAEAYFVVQSKLSDIVLTGTPPVQLLGITPSASLTPATPLEAGDYGWRVAAWNRSCGMGAASPLQAFTLPGTCPAPTAVPTSPVDGAVVDNPTRFEWRAEGPPVAALSVVMIFTAQGRFVTRYPASGRTFTMPMGLSSGDYAWVVVTWNSACGPTVSAPAFFRNSGRS